MAIKFGLYIPRGSEDSKDAAEIKTTLEKVRPLYNIKIINHIMDKKEENKLKSQILWHLSVVKRIGIKQTKRTKSLYPQLIVFSGNTPLTFYPQSYGKGRVTIQNFLEGLLNGKVKCLHDKYEIDDGDYVEWRFEIPPW